MFKNAYEALSNFCEKYHSYFILFIIGAGLFHVIRLILGYVVNPWDILVAYTFISVEAGYIACEKLVDRNKVK